MPSPTIPKELKYYVYLYIDPRNNEIFYVGKGKGNRCFSHLKETSETKKINRIEEIRKEGKEPLIEFLIHGIDEDTALRVEAAIIDILDKKLTNIVKGHHSSKIGRMSINKVLSLYKKEKANITEPSILIKVSKSFSYSMTVHELYDATRQCWKIAKDKKEKVKYAFSIFDGIIQEIYEIVSWYKGGSTFTTRVVGENHKERSEFIGKIADEKIRKKYLYKDVSHYNAKNQNPICYLNI